MSYVTSVGLGRDARQDEPRRPPIERLRAAIAA